MSPPYNAFIELTQPCGKLEFIALARERPWLPPGGSWHENPLFGTDFHDWWGTAICSEFICSSLKRYSGKGCTVSFGCIANGKMSPFLIRPSVRYLSTFPRGGRLFGCAAKRSFIWPSVNQQGSCLLYRFLLSLSNPHTRDLCPQISTGIFGKSD